MLISAILSPLSNRPRTRLTTVARTALSSFHFMRLLGFLTALTFSSTALGADYVWDPTNFYNSTNPVTTNQFTSEWVNNPDGSKSIKATVEKGPDYPNYNIFAVIPKTRLGDGTDFTAEMTFRVAKSTNLPKTFYIYARNTKGNSYDLWQNWVGEPGQSRTIRFPVQLPPIEGGTWSFFVGFQGSGSIIVDKLVIKEGRGMVRKEPVENVQAASALPSGTKVATGYKEITVALPSAEGPVTTISAEGLLIPDGATPVSEEIAIANNLALQKLLGQAQKTAGTKTLVIPKGVYRFGNRQPLNISDTKDLTFDGQGSEFIFQKLFTGSCFTVTNCERVVIKNIFFDWNWSYKPIASLGKVVSISDDKKTIEFEFPDQSAEQTKLTATSPWMGLFAIDPDTLYRSLKAKPANLYLGKVPKMTALGNRITVTAEVPAVLEVGESYCIRHLYYDLGVFKTSNCSNLTFDNITIYSMPGMGWINTGATNHWQFLNCNIIRRKGSRNPLTTAADGIHTGEAKGDMIIKNCEFTGLGDDSINLHDNSWQGSFVRGANENQLKLLNCPKHRLRMQAGDVIRFYNPDFSPSGVELTLASEPTYEGKPDAYAKTTIATVNFTTPVPEKLSSLSVATNTHFGTKNVLITDCRFLQTFGRSILYAGDDCTIENNVFRDVHNTPIQIQTDIVDNHWGEGYGSANLVIRNNVFENCNFAGRWEGAIIYSGGRFPWGQTEYPLYHDFLIENNRFINPPGPAMSFNFSKDIIARNNTIVWEKPAPNITPYSGTIQAFFCSNLFLGGNTWINKESQPNTGGVIYDPVSTKNVSADTNRLENTAKKE